MAHRCNTNPCGVNHNPVNQNNNDLKAEKGFLNIELFKDPMLEMLDMYELKMVLFDNCKPEEFLLFVKISNASGMLVANVNIQYLLTMLHGLAIRKFDILCAKFVSTTMAHLN